MVTHEEQIDAIRAYWREKKRKQRATEQDRIKKVLAEKGFTPSITRFELCSLCDSWHPTRAILPSGHFVSFSLGSFHILEKTDMVQSPLEMCIEGRMRFYNEDEPTAKRYCDIIINDPLQRHTPPGVPRSSPANILGQADLVPIAIDDRPWNSKDPTIRALSKSFTKKMLAAPDANPQHVVEECVAELKEKESDSQKLTVGDIFNKTPKEIAAMTKKKSDPTLTVGDLFGKTKKQILRMQKHGWDEEENQTFEACVREKMQKEGMTRKEAEDVCEALSDASGDRKLPAADGVAGQT